MKTFKSALDLFGKAIKLGDTVLYVCDNGKMGINHGTIVNIREDISNRFLIAIKNHALRLGQKRHTIDYVSQGCVVKYDFN